MHLPGKITYREIDEMIATVDKNEDWKISYSEFRVSISIIKSEICKVLLDIFILICIQKCKVNTEEMY